MKLREEQARLQGLLKETITLLCKNGLHFKNGFIIDALIGITTDDSETFLLKLEETVGDVGGEEKTVAEDGCYDGDRKSSQSRASRKRRKEGGNDSIAAKRQRAYSDDDDSDDYQDNDFNDDTIANPKDGHGNNQYTTVKQERFDYDGQYTQDNDQAHIYDALPDGDGQYVQCDQSPADGAPPDGSFDGDSRDGSSSTWNQSSANNDNNPTGSQQVRDMWPKFRVLALQIVRKAFERWASALHCV